MKVLNLILKFFVLIYILIESAVLTLLSYVDRSIQALGKVLLLIAPIAIYNVLDNLYNVTPRLTIFALGIFHSCLNLLSSGIHTLSQII